MTTTTMSSTGLVERPLRGFVLILGATLLFAANDATNKFLLTEYNAPLVTAIRYIVHCLLMLAVVAPIQKQLMFKTRRTGLVLVRAVCLATGSLLMAFALQRMPIAEATAIVYLSPILVILLAGLLLNEEVGIIGWVAAGMGFAGVLLIVRPGSGLDPIGVALVLCNVAAAVGYHLLSRVLASTERTVALLFYTALAGAILFGLALPWTLYGEVPTPIQVMLFISLGVTAGLGHYLFTAAYRYAPANLLAPMNYMHLVWAALLGWLVFNHAPEPLTLIGIAIIALAGVLSALRTRRPVPVEPA
ncbi:DMT family transporter [Devosia sp. 2618]|uniref:DMT family transporter n=1 Tax=Devosia sp. 2618 TaxID=3156454 RepID=UPI0033933E19